MRITEKKIKEVNYTYLEKSVRIGKTVRNVAHYIGRTENLNKTKIEKAKKEFLLALMQKEATLRTEILLKTITHLEQPLDIEKIKKIEAMNLQYKQIVKELHPKNIKDLWKRFIANYVFESNALEGNSLTLKNVAEVVFEKRISQGKDLREIYDAQNSYNAFLQLIKKKKSMDHTFIIKLHKQVLDKIDDRTGYRNVPMSIVGKPTVKLSKPENIKEDMTRLLKWYNQHENTLYPLELAFKFHTKFEQIEPFCDGNGRVGRLLLNYILMKKRYFPVIIRKTSRKRYIKALEAADKGHWVVLMRFALKNYKETFHKFFEIYAKYCS
jgi:Fic family protein